MTPEKFLTATVLFHLGVLMALTLFTRRLKAVDVCRRSWIQWSLALLRGVFALAVVVYALSLAATLAANWNWGRAVRIGPISLRLLGQALFIEGPLLAAFLAWRHHRARQQSRAWLLAMSALLLAAVHVDAYYLEPSMVVPRHYVVPTRIGGRPTQTIRILHLTDIQTPTIGEHEEKALRLGLSFRPDLIVLTGDYVQDALGRATEMSAAADLRALMERIGFTAPLGVFATEGDVGPPCGVVFAGTPVRCLANRSALVELPGGGTLSITGLMRGTGRERDPRVLDRILDAAPAADHRLVISHAPDFVSALKQPVDLVLAGHTHGGQVVIPFFGPPRTAIRLPRRYAGGLNEYAGIPIHVSRGIGMERGFDIPVRFLCPPEIGILDLQLAERNLRAAETVLSYSGRGLSSARGLTGESPRHDPNLE